MMFVQEPWIDVRYGFQNKNPKALTGGDSFVDKKIDVETSEEQIAVEKTVSAPEVPSIPPVPFDVIAIPITEDISKDILSLSYIDSMHGQPDSVSITVHDKDQKWVGDWSPQKGDLISVEMGLKTLGFGALPIPPLPTDPKLECGIFEIDSLSYKGSPDTLTINAVSMYVTEDQKTTRTVTYEDAQLSSVVDEVLKRFPSVFLSRNNKIDDLSDSVEYQQKDKSDVHFLKLLAEETGHIFNMKGDTMVFHSCKELYSEKPVATLKRTEIMSFSFKDQTHDLNGSYEVFYQVKNRKKTIVKATATDSEMPTKNAQTVEQEFPNEERAARYVESQVLHKNFPRTGSVTLPGNVDLVAGNKVEIEGFGNFDGVYIISRSVHTVSRGNGYTTQLEVKSNV